MHLIESCIKLSMSWTAKTVLAKAIAEFDQGWHALMLFCSAEPAIRLECNYMHRLYLTVRTKDIQNPDLIVEFKTSALKNRFPEMKETDVAEMQSQYLRMVLTAILTMALPSVAAMPYPAMCVFIVLSLTPATV